MARILIVDDEPGLLRMSRRALKSAGHAVAGCQNGREALLHLKACAADLMISDIFMPEMEGLEAIRTAHKLYPELPIVAVSGGGLGGSDYLQAARVFGAVAVLRKPFRPSELVELVDTLLAPSGG